MNSYSYRHRGNSRPQLNGLFDVIGNALTSFGSTLSAVLPSAATMSSAASLLTPVLQYQTAKTVTGAQTAQANAIIAQQQTQQAAINASAQKAATQTSGGIFGFGTTGDIVVLGAAAALVYFLVSQRRRR